MVNRFQSLLSTLTCAATTSQSSDGKPMTFRRILLNTCQEEFEGAGKAREELLLIENEAELFSSSKRVKLRTMGNIKLIGELYKKKMIAEKILHACISDLLGRGLHSSTSQLNSSRV
jgi:translation initiation factor 4G